jgi:hypothetical protein
MTWRTGFALLLLSLSFPAWSELAPSTSSSPDTSPNSTPPSPPTRTLKVPPGLSIDPSLSDLGATLLLLRIGLVEQSKASQRQLDASTSTAPELTQSSEAVSSSLGTASTATSQASASLTDASTTWSDTSKASTVYDASVGKTEADLQAQVSAIAGERDLLRLGAIGAGVVAVVSLVWAAVK